MRGFLLRSKVERLMWVVVAVSLFTGCRPSPKQGTPGPSKPHVFVIVFDTLRWDRVGSAHGAPSLTPNMDRIAEEAFVYQRAYAQSSWTKTSVASLMTGVYPYRHQVFKESIKHGTLPKSATTIAERLKKEGYGTLAVSMNPHVAKRTGFKQGFDAFVHQKAWYKKTNEQATGAVIRHLRTSRPEQPQLVYLHYLDPHDPWQKRSDCEKPLAQKGLTTSRRNVQRGMAFRLSGESLIKNLTRSKETPKPLALSRSDKQYLRTLYDCEVSAVDRAFGELLIYLRRNARFNDALFVLTADHGEEFWEHGMLRHGYQLYDETVHVPLIVRPPPGRAVSPGGIETLVELVDIPATIYHLLDIPVKPADLDGRSLFGRGSPSPEERKTRAFGMTRFRNQDEAYLIEGPAKIHHDFKSGQCTLFDIDKDRRERNPAPCDVSGVGREMQSSLMAMKAAQTKTAFAPDDAPDDEAGDDVLQEQLKELGYVQ
jgi:arylsulfatase A-like enzyme